MLKQIVYWKNNEKINYDNNDNFLVQMNKQKVNSIKSFSRKKQPKQDKNYCNPTKNLYDNEPAGLIQACILGKIIKRAIRIWQNNKLIYVFGKINGKKEIDLEFKEHRIKKNSNQIHYLGHWTLRGGRNPFTASVNKNNCLYDVIASQTGMSSTELRRRTVNAMRQNLNWPIPRFFSGSDINLKLGGARYSGTSPRDAEKILNNSQYSHSHPDGQMGHSRGHASHSVANRVEDSVETYSYSRWRSGFLSRIDQDLVCHYTLITNSAQRLMDKLNHGQLKVAEHISRNELDYDPLPQAQIWSGGSRQGSPGNFRTVCVVGKHFLKKQNDIEENVFILTFYPIL